MEVDPPGHLVAGCVAAQEGAHLGFLEIDLPGDGWTAAHTASPYSSS